MLWLKEWANSDSHPKIVAAGFWGATVFRCLCRVSAEFDLDGRIPPVYHRSHYIAHRLQLIFEEPITCGQVGARSRTADATDATDAVAWIDSGTSDAVSAGLLRKDGDDLIIDGWGERQTAASQAMSNTERSRAFRARKAGEGASRNEPATGCNGATLEKSRGEKRRVEEKKLLSSTSLTRASNTYTKPDLAEDCLLELHEEAQDVDPTVVLDEDPGVRVRVAADAPASDSDLVIVALDTMGPGPLPSILPKSLLVSQPELPGTPPPPSAEDMQRIWNEVAPPKCARWLKNTNGRRKAADLRLEEHKGDQGGALAWWRRMVEKVAASAFLRGERTQWCAYVDWMLKPASLVKLEEGKYDDRSGDVRTGSVRAEDMQHSEKVGVVSVEEWVGDIEA